MIGINNLIIWNIINADFLSLKYRFGNWAFQSCCINCQKKKEKKGLVHATALTTKFKSKAETNKEDLEEC